MEGLAVLFLFQEINQRFNFVSFHRYLPTPSIVGATKKMVIKPFKVQPKVPDNFGLETWEVLRSAIDAVYTKNASDISKEELYRVSDFFFKVGQIFSLFS
jgi:hypothetical protein